MSENEPAGEQPTGVPLAPPEQPQDAPSPTPPGPAAPERRRLQRSRDDRVIAGVCGGLGEYLGVDAVLIRIAALILLFAGGAGLFLYVIGWIAMPEAPEEAGGTATVATAPGERTTGAVVLGLLFVIAGVFFLLDQAVPDFVAWKWVWPFALIGVGLVVILRARR